MNYMILMILKLQRNQCWNLSLNQQDVMSGIQNKTGKLNDKIQRYTHITVNLQKLWAPKQTWKFRKYTFFVNQITKRYTTVRPPLDRVLYVGHTAFVVQ